MKKWTKEEEELVVALVEHSYKKDSIALELDRSLGSVVMKMSRLGLLKKQTGSKPYKKKGRGRTTSQYKLELPNDIWVLEEYINAKTHILHMHSCGYEWLAVPHNILQGSGCPKCAKHGLKTRTHAEYLELIPDDIEVLDTYINSKTKLRHKHSCGHIWSAVPGSIIHQKTGCPKCAKHGFDIEESGITYVLYFSSLGIYKIGITNDLDKRIKQFGIKPSVVFYREFSSGADALLLEKEWLHNVRHLRYNSNKLTTGNTETFKI